MNNPMTKDNWIVVQRVVRGWANDPKYKGTPWHAKGAIVSPDYPLEHKHLSEVAAKEMVKRLHDEDHKGAYIYWAIEVEDF